MEVGFAAGGSGLELMDCRRRGFRWTVDYNYTGTSCAEPLAIVQARPRAGDQRHITGEAFMDGVVTCAADYNVSRRV